MNAMVLGFGHSIGAYLMDTDMLVTDDNPALKVSCKTINRPVT